MTKILVVDDDNAINELIKINLELQGYEVVQAFNGIEGFALAKQEEPSLIILDVMMPEVDGFTVAQRIRQCPEIAETPIIMLTARDEIEDKVNGLDLGADDYLTKPFAIQELLARMRACMRKHNSMPKEAEQGEVLSVKNLKIYTARYEVEVNGEPVELTKTEYDLLEFLVRNRRNILSRDQILSKVWGYDYSGDTNVVDVYIRYLRAKIDDRFGEKYIHTMRGVGYGIKD